MAQGCRQVQHRCAARQGCSACCCRVTAAQARPAAPPPPSQPAVLLTAAFAQSMYNRNTTGHLFSPGQAQAQAPGTMGRPQAWAGMACHGTRPGMAGYVQGYNGRCWLERAILPGASQPGARSGQVFRPGPVCHFHQECLPLPHLFELLCFGRVPPCGGRGRDREAALPLPPPVTTQHLSPPAQESSCLPIIPLTHISWHHSSTAVSRSRRHMLLQQEKCQKVSSSSLFYRQMSITACLNRP